MMLVAGHQPDARILKKLAEWQGNIDQLGTFADQVAAAKRAFRSRNTKSNATFRAVRASLATMCPGARRCNYCEDSAADEVEHIAPKTLFPSRTFDFDNYLYACGPCNGPKNDQYAVRDANGVEHELARAANVGAVAPVGGQPLLIDPRRENPADFMELDLRNTFFFTPIPGADTFSARRAEWTIATLALNSRDYLPDARRDAFHTFSSMLAHCAAEQRKDPAADLSILRKNLMRNPHTTVFREMQRQATYDPDVGRHFNGIIDALFW